MYLDSIPVLSKFFSKHIQFQVNQVFLFNIPNRQCPPISKSPVKMYRYIYIQYICIYFFSYTCFDVKLVKNPAILRSKHNGISTSHQSSVQPRFNGFVSRRFQVDFPRIFQGLIPGWWFQAFFIFIPIWGNDPNWLIFFRWVETTS